MSGSYWFTVFFTVLFVSVISQIFPERLMEAIVGCAAALGILGTLEILGRKGK